MNSDRTVLMATHFSACWNREKYVLCNLENVINLIDQGYRTSGSQLTACDKNKSDSRGK